MLRPAIAFCLTLTAPIAQADVPRVVTDIAPVQSLVSMVLGDIGRADVLLRPGASPHGYALRPSEARALDQADLVVFIGEGLTPWIRTPLENTANTAQQLELLNAPGTTLLAMRELEDFDDDGHHHGHDEGHGHEDEDGHDEEDEDTGERLDDHHDHGSIDPHAWLDPHNAVVWVGAIADVLAELDPENAATYLANASSAKEELNQLADDVASTLPEHPRSYILLHDGYQYFENRFGLDAIGVISLGDATPPSARQIVSLKQKLEDEGPVCAFSEVQLPDRVMRALDHDGLRLLQLDPLGANVAPGKAHYITTIKEIGSAFMECNQD